ncbi:hypothetical protein ACIQGZ_27630 [Streptomyces sp. NPDC092296]|uniref:hypothetical protein n=1 Tax=Streptomyces sp. NPDC092296 TaxID=3366012 RepID=UPI00382C6196
MGTSTDVTARSAPAGRHRHPGGPTVADRGLRFVCEQTARTADSRPRLLARVEAASPAAAAYWLLARALDVGVQLDGEGLHAVWGELRDAGEYLRALTALRDGSTYVLEMATDEVIHRFTVRPAAQYAAGRTADAADRARGPAPTHPAWSLAPYG